MYNYLQRNIHYFVYLQGMDSKIVQKKPRISRRKA